MANVVEQFLNLGVSIMDEITTISPEHKDRAAQFVFLALSQYTTTE
jgi:hypothetical protein